jgi:large subunit ribosomal protein L11
MNKKITVKLQVKAQEANPSPPIGPMLGSKGINIMKFCTEFNQKTKDIIDLKKGTLVPVVINIYPDKSFDFLIKSPPTSILIKNILNIEKGSSLPNKNKITNITNDQIMIVFNQKKNDLIVNSVDSGIKSIKGTARSMGINIEETNI